MNRYQFEDLISEYVENELSLSKRKEFEAYLEEKPDAMELVESVRANMAQMKIIPRMKVSADFNDRLLAKIQTDHARLHRPTPSQRTFFWIYTGSCILDDRIGDRICFCVDAVVFSGRKRPPNSNTNLCRRYCSQPFKSNFAKCESPCSRSSRGRRRFIFRRQ